MTTLKTRINISASAEMESALKMLAKKDRTPVASKAVELLELALDIQEDIRLGKMADESVKMSGKKTYSHTEAWKKFSK